MTKLQKPTKTYRIYMFFFELVRQQIRLNVFIANFFEHVIFAV